jgi:hypothetical protein
VDFWNYRYAAPTELPNGMRASCHRPQRLTDVSFLIHHSSEKRIHCGSCFRDFLKEDGILEEVEERAVKKALALQLEKLIAKNGIIKIGWRRG